MDFKIIGDRLLKEYPELTDYVEITERHIYFSILAGDFNQSSLCPLMIYADKSGKLVVEGCLDPSSTTFPPAREYTVDSDKLKGEYSTSDWYLNNTRECYDVVYKEIIPYIPIVKAAIKGYNSMDFKGIGDTLTSLGFERRNKLRYQLIDHGIVIDVILPVVNAPYFHLVVKRAGTPYQKGSNIFATTFDEMLNKLMEEN